MTRVRKSKAKVVESEEETTPEEAAIQEDVDNTKSVKGSLRYLKLITGEEIFATVISSLVVTEGHPHATYMIKYPLKLTHVSLDGEPAMMFKPWIANSILGSEAIPIKDDKIITHTSIPAHLRPSYLQYLGNMIEDEEREEAQQEAKQQKHLH